MNVMGDVMLRVWKDEGMGYLADPAQGLINPYPALPRQLKQTFPCLWYEP